VIFAAMWPSIQKESDYMIETAIRHPAIKRKISRQLSGRSALPYLKMLGIGQACRYQGMSLARFLLSDHEEAGPVIEKPNPMDSGQQETKGSGL
jgi:hypothetical protein